MEFYKLINKELIKKYGVDLVKRPMYQLVQNKRSLVEKRIGNWRTYYGHIFIREEHGVQEVPKYNYIPEGFWVREKLYYTTNPELTQNFSYEPLWCFRDPQTDGYQQPNLKAVMFIIEMALHGKKEVESREALEAREEQTFYEMLGGNAGIAESIASQEGVSYAGLEIPNGRSK